MGLLWSDFLTNEKRAILKWKHYFPIYERHFSRFVNTDVVFVEIGVGDGGSLQMWKRYLGPHARIIGIDIEPRCTELAEDQIEIRIGNQSDPEFLASIVNEFGSPDVVIDDGSHVMSHINATFAFLYPKVGRNGIYLVEDLHTAYWEEYEGGLGRKDSFIETCKGLIDELNADHARDAIAPTEFTRSTLSMHIYDSVVVFEKGRHTAKKLLHIGTRAAGSAAEHQEDTMAKNTWPNSGRRITISPTGVVKSPSFHTRYPGIINDDLIEPGAKHAMDESWKRGFFEERDLEFFRVRGVYVVGEGLILDSDLQVIQNVSDDYTDEEVMRAVEDVMAAREAGTIPHFDRLTHLTKRRAAHNYGHFLLEALPMAYIGAKCVSYDRPRYLVHTAPPPSQDVMFRSLRLLGIDLNDVIVQGSREPMYFDDLLVVRGMTKHGTYMSPLCVRAIDRMARRTVLQFSTLPGAGGEKLFVRRVPGWRRGRKLHNEMEVSERLSACGFLTIEPGSMSLDHQIALFSRAKHVVGVSGAAMTNIAFCGPETKITVLVPGTFPDTFFWFIAQHRHLDFVEIRGDQTTYDPPESWNAGFTIREKDIAYLEGIRTVTG